MANINNKKINLVADIGGTNIRLAITENNNITAIRTYECANYPKLSDVILQYIQQQGLGDASINACLAIACPTDDDLISMTNLPWKFSQKGLKEKLNLHSLTLINDYTAIAMAIPLLTDDQKNKNWWW
jgi:glucokinase